MDKIFTVYFRILKQMSRTNLLAPVLEGLAKFAHLINIEFVDDLIKSLFNLVNSGVRILSRLKNSSKGSKGEVFPGTKTIGVFALCKNSLYNSLW